MEAAILIGVVIVWLGCAFGCARLAKRKNRSAFVWFVLGLILGIITLLIIGVMKKKTADGDGDSHGQEDDGEDYLSHQPEL